MIGTSGAECPTNCVMLFEEYTDTNIHCPSCMWGLMNNQDNCDVDVGKECKFTDSTKKLCPLLIAVL
eukprot:9542456-Ditylum_brightwellii.AAC.1